MKKIIQIAILTLGVLFSTMQGAYAQCAMCRASLETNVSNGEAGISGSLNTGILFLLVMPYLMVAVIAILWYKKSRQNGRKVSIS